MKKEKSANKITEDFDDNIIVGPSKCLMARALISAMLINILIGSYYVYGNINEYCANFIGVDPKQTMFIQPLWLFVQGTGVVFSIRLCEKFGYRLINFWSFFIYILTNLACAWIKNLWLFFLSFGIISGIVVGFGYLPSLYIAWTYFPNNKSQITGCILFFAGLSTLILAPLSTGIVNPDNLDPADPRVTERVPMMWYCISGQYTVIFITSVSLQPKPWVLEEPSPPKIISGRITESIKDDINTSLKDLDSPAKRSYFNVKTDTNKLNKNQTDFNNLAKFKGTPRKKDSLEIHDDNQNNNFLKKEINIIPADTQQQNNIIKSPFLALETENSNDSGQNFNKIKSRETYNILFGDEAGFKMDSKEFDQQDFEAVEYFDKKMIEVDVKGVLSEGEIALLGTIPYDKLNGLAATFDYRTSKQYTKRLTKAMTSRIDQDDQNPMDVYSQSKQLMETECPSIYSGLTSIHYVLMISVVTLSLTYDYFLNSVWKSYGSSHVKGSDGLPVSDRVITNVMIIASMFNAFVRIFVGKLLATVSYKKFYLCLLVLKIVSAFCLQYAAHNIYTYTIVVSYAYICIGAQSTQFPTFTVKVFGTKVGAKMFPMIYFFFAMANVLQWALNYFIFNTDELTDYLIYILGCCVCLSFVLTQMIQETPNWHKYVVKFNEENEKKANLKKSGNTEELLAKQKI